MVRLSSVWEKSCLENGKGLRFENKEESTRGEWAEGMRFYSKNSWLRQGSIGFSTTHIEEQ